MTVKALLWTKVLKKDGTHDIKIYVYHKRKKMYYSVGVSVPPECWDETRQQVKAHPLAKAFNHQIETTITHFRQLLLEGVPANELNKEQKKDSHSLLQFLDRFISEIEKGFHDINKNSCKNYRVVAKRLRAYCADQELEDLHFEDINLDFYHRYFDYVIANGGGRSGFGNHIKLIKRLMRTAQERGLHDNTIYTSRDFRVLKEPAGDKIYLTPKEIETLEQLDLSSMPHLDHERDRFLISYYFLMRWEDSTRISPHWIDPQGFLTYTAQKTGIKCTLPVGKKARGLLKKRNFHFAGDTNQEANRKLKQIGSLAGINQVVTQGGKKAPKFHFITTHTARRSAATNLYLERAHLEDILKLGGWKKIDTLKKYLRASGMEVARMAKGYDFFK